LGYGLLLKKYTPNVTDATEEQIKMAARDTIPKVAPMFWTFRIMVAAGFMILFIFAAAFYYTAKRTIAEKRWLLRLALYCIPLPWIAAEMGWIVAEYGRQPWTISGILPTSLSTSNLSASSVYFSLAGFIGFYSLLLVAELYLMFKYARLGPQSLHTGNYGNA
jgi:cytochrome d ubiquinol oxidase subunit I